jgi:hypothetical protein
MVNLASGDMSYVLPLMDVGGMPLTLSYHGGIPTDLESTWVGLGWNLNPGAINRSLNGTPDDWKGGNSVDFLSYVNCETTYTVNVGVGIAAGAEVGVGASWGSNKAMSGSINASFGYGHMGGGVSIDTNGNYSLGIGGGTGKAGQSGFGGGLTMSGNVNGGKIGFGVGVGARTSGGLTIGVGASLDGSSAYASIGYSNVQGGDTGAAKGQAGGGSLSMSSFSKGDWKIKSEGFYIPCQIYIFTFGFGKQKTTYTLRKGYNKVGYGSLYAADDSPTNTPILNQSIDGQFTDYQNRYRYTDAYEQELPVPEKQFVGDYDAQREKVNFTYTAYDSYEVNGAGISGVVMPKILQNATVFGMGYSGNDPNDTSEEPGKVGVYYHNSLPTTKKFGVMGTNINFYFNGQFTQNVNANGRLTPISDPLANPLTPINNNSTSLENMLSDRGSSQNPRLKQGNFTQVYTNKQIRNNQATDLLSPINPTSDGSSPLTELQRNPSKYKDDAIGGYVITAPDGKVYHYGQPVLHYEMVERNILKNNSEDHVSEKRQYTSYATHWLLTAITGPDYLDTNNNHIADPADYGYWVRLDYGNWSDGYVWRNPTDKNLKDYNTNIENNIGEKEFGTYQFGRKQLFYLDRVVSATHTAYFVKNLRYDSAGSDLNYHFDPNIALTNNGTSPNIEDPASQLIYPHEDFTYKRQLQLMLDKIVLVKNEKATVSKGNYADSYLNNNNLPNYVDGYSLNFNPNGGFYAENGGVPIIDMNNEGYVYDVHDFAQFDNNNALKVIQFNYNYNLAAKDATNDLNNPDIDKSAGSPGTVFCPSNPNAGKLCLKSIKFLGKNNYDYMPPYQFEYKGEYGNSDYIMYPPNAIIQKQERILTTGGLPSYDENGDPIYDNIEIPINNVRAKDEWGYLKGEGRAEAWSMTKIITPTGASIQIENEEDDYFTEAFSRRYWMDNLKMLVQPVGTSYIDVHIRNQDGLAGGLQVDDFSKYFEEGANVFIDLWICRKKKIWTTCGDIISYPCTQSDYGNVSITSLNNSKVLSAGIDEVVVRVENIGGISNGDDAGLALYSYFCKSLDCGITNVYTQMPRGECPVGAPAPSDTTTMSYKLLATNTPPDETGGGLRVKSITVNDELGNKYKTSYYYNNPEAVNGVVKKKNEEGYKSSGITSYSPVRGTKFIPYQVELPTPGVMYEYVTMVMEAENGDALGKTRYRYKVLRPVLDIFDENIVMKDDDETIIFKATVTDHETSGGYLNPNKKIIAKSVKLDINTSLIGQLRSIEEFNAVGQLMSKLENHYKSGINLKNSGLNKGSITESFQSMKSVFTTNENDENPALRKRLLSISTKEEYASVLQSITTTGMHGKTTETYSNTDPETGAFLRVNTIMADGTRKQVERVPAYTMSGQQYQIMGPKSSGGSRRMNMLTQEAMNITSIYKDDIWKTIEANITTWNLDWTYRDSQGHETHDTDPPKTGLVRKHKTFVWKENTSLDGAFLTEITPSTNYFNWTTGQPTNNNWLKTSEITRYNHYSIPVETKDVNSNFASSKMADNDSKVLVSGNCRYTEMYYTGAEYQVGNTNYFDGEVLGALNRTSDIAHTGQYSVKAENLGDKLFQVQGKSGPENYYSSNLPYNYDFRPGKYKVSFWVYRHKTDNERPAIPAGGSTAITSYLYLNDQPIKESEVVDAGCWQQYNYYIDIPANTDENNIVVKPILLNGQNYFDDFRMHPIASSINSYVYNNETDMLSYKLDSNNMATAYTYDNAGRLIATYIEDVDNSETIEGGFKLISQNKQRYKGMNTNANFVSDRIDNCKLGTGKLSVTIANQEVNSYQNKFTITAAGGSGNYEYSYKWLIDDASQRYSNFIQGNSKINIPYAPEFCNGDLGSGIGTFAKKWDVIVKVKDLMTNLEVLKQYSYKGECVNKRDNVLESEIQITSKEPCANDKYDFRIYPKASNSDGNYKYEYAIYNPNVAFDTQTLQWIDVSSASGAFCPDYAKIPDSGSATGYRKVLYYTYRITDLTSGEVSDYNPNVFFSVEALQSEYLQLLPGISSDQDYVKEGMLLVKTKSGIIDKFYTKL